MVELPTLDLQHFSPEFFKSPDGVIIRGRINAGYLRRRHTLHGKRCEQIIELSLGL